MIGKQIKTLRQLYGINQTGLALVVGISQSAISQFESGKLKLSEKKQYRIAEALEIPIEKKRS